MAAEWRNKAESFMVKIGRPSALPNGGLWPIHDNRVRHPLLAKEPLCGNQSANLSLVIAVLRFPSYFVFLLLWLLVNKEVFIDNRN